jgi:radical SAM superfamily enzyme YgiQ (UPF0313 family)/2-polyprenyl-3-methyl-5-hydroxy-6-metoxy-1,4-benzoquinol methylase
MKKGVLPPESEMDQMGSKSLHDASFTVKRVLFINPGKKDDFRVDRIHMGLTLLGGILADHGHEVKVIDYAFLRWRENQIKIPSVEEAVSEFNPDVVGITVFTYLYDESLDVVERISRTTDAPIVLGGPHFTIFPDDFRNDARVSCIVRGEAENVILDLIESAKQQSRPVFIDAPIPSAEDIPEINLDIAYGSEHLNAYMIQLSRGCPYKCTFCNIKNVAGRKIRARDIHTCLEQIREAKKSYPSIRQISITDDCPTFNKERFKEFLRLFKEMELGCSMFIDNVRANLINEDLIQLYVAAGGTNICLGIESGHPEIFMNIHKGESLEDIVEAARLVKKYGLTLGGCFVIGLPGDNLKRHKYTIEFAKSLNLDYVFWNMVYPWPGTVVGEWYREHGKVGELRNGSSLIDRAVKFDTPPATTPDFREEDRIRAWLMVNMERRDYFYRRSVLRLFLLSVRYGLYRHFYYYFTRSFLAGLINVLRGELRRRFDMFIKGAVSVLLKRNSRLEYFEKICGIPHFVLIRSVESMLFSDCVDKKKSPFLDLGCGDGTFGGSLKLEELYGIDISEKSIESAKKCGYYKNVMLASASDIPFPNGFFGTLYSNCAMEHMDEIDSVLKEARRVLKEDGELVFAVPVSGFLNILRSDPLLRGHKLNTDDTINEYNRIHNHVNIFDFGTWKEKLESAGFLLVAYRYYLPEPFGSFVARMEVLHTIKTHITKKLLREQENRHFSFSNLPFKLSMWKYARNPKPSEDGICAIFKAVKK